MRLLLPLAACAAITAPLAAAPAESDVVEVRIALDNVDLGNAAERAALERRIETRLREACSRPAPAWYDRARSLLDQTCLADARKAASAQLEQAALAQVRAGREVSAN